MGAFEAANTNRPPVANAADRPSPAGAGCLAAVALDGRASSDPDGDGLTYTWTGAFGSASGATPSVSLPPGAQRSCSRSRTDEEGRPRTTCRHRRRYDTTRDPVRDSVAVSVAPGEPAVRACHDYGDRFRRLRRGGELPHHGGVEQRPCGRRGLDRHRRPDARRARSGQQEKSRGSTRSRSSAPMPRGTARRRR